MLEIINGFLKIEIFIPLINLIPLINDGNGNALGMRLFGMFVIMWSIILVYFLVAKLIC